MKIEKYLPTSQDVLNMESPTQVGVGRTIFQVITIIRDEQRREIEDNPRRDDTILKNDIVFKLGMIYLANWILTLPEQVRLFKNKILERQDFQNL